MTKIASRAFSNSARSLRWLCDGFTERTGILVRYESDLTPEEKATLEAMDPGVRDQILTWLMLGDPILMREARAKLAPPRPRPEAPRTLPELLGRIREDPSYPALAASGLAAAFQDPKSYSGYLRRCEEAWRGELNPARLVSAYDQAMGPKARNRGAIFMYAVHRE